MFMISYRIRRQWSRVAGVGNKRGFIWIKQLETQRRSAFVSALTFIAATAGNLESIFIL